MLISFCKDSSERTSGKIKYKVVTMKGQFVFPVYGANETVTLKYDRSKMNMTDMGLGAINDHELQMKIVNG